MPSMPHFLFYLSASKIPVSESDPFWTRPLPLTPHPGFRPDGSGKESAVTYGEYFSAVRRFIERERFSNLIMAVRACTGRSVAVRLLGPINIYLEKHGQFYHPARLTVKADGTQLSFVVNVAVTTIGRSYLRNDFDNIKLLNRRYPNRFLPQVYANGAMLLFEPSHRMTMFLGQWLDGYHEFHLSGEPAEGNDRLLVWNTLQGAHRLSSQVRCDVYRQAAKILTTYYNLETFEQVFSWHHAAGDFIVKADGRNIDLRLITVRKYAPLFDGMGTDARTIIQALLVFLLNLTVKMRLDRLDGVGAAAWASDDAVAATLNGFFDGLFLQVDSDRIPAELPDVFATYLKSLTAAELQDVLDAVFERNFRQTSESEMIRKHLKHHGDTLLAAIRRWPRNRDSTPI